MAGSELGGYVLGERIGAGATATVYRARRGAEEVALKLLHPHLLGDQAVRARFVREVSLARQLRHSSIVRIHDLVAWGQMLALAMEFCPGGSLSGWRTDSSEEVVRVAREVGGALAVAHEQGVIHRDLKPQNILRDAEGRHKICDFGSAGVQESLAQSGSSLLVGSPQYVAPEVWGGHPPDPRIDLYALGAILYEAVTGRPPRTRALPRADTLAEVPDRSGLDAALPRWLADLLLELLAPIERRLPDARGLLRALGRGGGPERVPMKSCLFCGVAIPEDAPVCLHCGEEELALRAPEGGERYSVVLRKASEEAAVLQELTEILRAISREPGYSLDIMLGDVRMYSRLEQKRLKRLPVRLVDDLGRHDAERLGRVLDRVKVRCTVQPTQGMRRARRGPLVRAAHGTVLRPEGADFLTLGAARIPALEDSWMRSLTSRLLFSAYRLEARAATHELREYMRSALLELRGVAERAVADLASAGALLRGVDRAELYAELARATRALEDASEDGDRVEGAPLEDPSERQSRALEALRKREETELLQSRIIARVLTITALLEDLSAALERSTEGEDALREAMAELDRELSPPAAGGS